MVLTTLRHEQQQYVKPPEPLKRLVLILGVFRRHAVRTADLLERIEHGIGRDAEPAQKIADPSGDLGHRQQEVFGREVVVAQLGPLDIGGLEEPERIWGDLGRLGRGPVDLGQFRQRRLDLIADGLGRDADALEHREDHALGLADERGQQMFATHLVVIVQGAVIPLPL